MWMNVSAGLAGLSGSILLTLPLALPKGRARKNAAFAVGGLILLALLGVWLAGVLDAALIGKLFALLLIVMGVTGFFSTGAAHKNKGRPCLI